MMIGVSTPSDYVGTEATIEPKNSTEGRGPWLAPTSIVNGGGAPMKCCGREHCWTCSVSGAPYPRLKLSYSKAVERLHSEISTRLDRQTKEGEMPEHGAGRRPGMWALQSG